MEQYIDKDALVAEIESLRRTTFTNFDEGVNATVQTLLEVVDTLEVKEVDSTDAFIEKATEWLKENKDHPLIGCEDICLSGYLTDEFIEDFKNYMKGE